jgi:ribosome-associated toxin RatA of RatAB toxin-antitoxin module
MTDEATKRIHIEAPPEACYAIAIDFERYPEWAADVKNVEVLEVDDEGRGVSVRFRVGALGQSTKYTLAYDHGKAPNTLPWVQTSGDLTRKLDGEYVFEDDGQGGTDMTFHLTVDLKVPLVGFIKRRAEARILSTALRDLKARAES